MREVWCKVSLYNASNKTVYELDNEDKAKDLAGQKVKVEGTLNHATKTIHVDTRRLPRHARKANSVRGRTDVDS